MAGVSYSTAVRVQNNREEIIVDLESMAVGLIKKFFKKTKRKPERIIFYRDGVSEGQYAEVCRREIRALKRESHCSQRVLRDMKLMTIATGACALLEPTYAPPITYIICGKRHHIRFFPSTQDGGDRSGNVRAGTVIDLDIVHPVDNDFVSFYVLCCLSCITLISLPLCSTS